MNSKHLYFGFVGLVLLLGVGLLASARVANIALEHQSKTLGDLKAQRQALEEQQTQLVQDKKDIAAYSDLNTIAKSVVPQDKDQAEAVREIVGLAAQSGIAKLSAITFPPSTLGGTSTKRLTQVTPVKGIGGVYELPITVTQGNDNLVPYSNFVAFLSKVEQNRRTAEVSSISIQPDQTNTGMIAFTLVIDEFIKP